MISASAWALNEKAPEKSSFSTDQSDLWWNPNESGWGMQIVQQADSLFATLFVYDASGQPTFFIASMNPVANLTWTGDLYRSIGPWFGGPFNPAAVGDRKVGSITLNTPFVNSGTLQYSVDGVPVNKAVHSAKC